MAKLSALNQAGNGYADPDWVRREVKRRREEEDPWAPATLLPPEAFSDEVTSILHRAAQARIS